MAKMFDPRKFANGILRAYRFVTLTDNQELLIYDPIEGRYRDRAETVIGGAVQKAMNEAEDKKSLAHMVNEVTKWVRLEASNFRKRQEFDADPHRILVANGILNIMTRELEPFSPDFLTRIRLPVKFDRRAKCAHIEKFIHQVVQPEDIETVFEMIGYTLEAGYPIQTAIVIVGEGANGKSVTLEVVRQFLGRDNCVSVPVQHLNENNFAPAQLEGRLANIVGDLPSKKMASTGRFKEATGGDMIYAEHKNRAPFHFVNRAKFIFSCNQLPDSDDDTRAYYRRWIIVKFPFVFEGKSQRNRDELISELTTPEEISGLLNRALDSLEGLMKRGRFANDTKSLAEKRIEHKRLANSVFAFVHDRLEDEQDAEVGKKELYGAYVDHCRASLKIDPLNEVHFFRKLREQLGGAYNESMPRNGDKRARVITGFKLAQVKSRVPVLPVPAQFSTPQTGFGTSKTIPPNFTCATGENHGVERVTQATSVVSTSNNIGASREKLLVPPDDEQRKEFLTKLQRKSARRPSP